MLSLVFSLLVSDAYPKRSRTAELGMGHSLEVPRCSGVCVARPSTSTSVHCWRAKALQRFEEIKVTCSTITPEQVRSDTQEGRDLRSVLDSGYVT